MALRDPVELSIPASWEQVDAAWVSSALQSSFPGVEVSDVTLLLRDDGTNRRARVGVSYAKGAGPDRVFLKASDPEHAELNARTGGLFNEPRLFACGADLPVDHPAVYAAVMDEARLDFILVMEDVTARGADPRDATRPLTLDQASNGIRALARMHSAYWNDRLLDEPRLSWVEPFRAWDGMHVTVDIGMKNVRHVLPAPVRSLSGSQVTEGHWARFISTVADGAQTLLHGDAHIGNTYVLPDNSVGFLDWQVVRRGNFALDLGYFLQGAVTVDDRRAAEAALIDTYIHALGLQDDEKPTPEEVWLRYRASAAHGLALWLATAAGRWQRPEVSLVLAERYAAAFVDLDSAAAIRELT